MESLGKKKRKSLDSAARNALYAAILAATLANPDTKPAGIQNALRTMERAKISDTEIPGAERTDRPKKVPNEEAE